MIRPAELRDIDQLTQMLLSFARASLLDYSVWEPADVARAKSTLLDLIRHHYLIVAEDNQVLVGMIGAMREKDFWIASRTRLRELFWWVEPAYRRSRISAELYLTWERDTERFVKTGLVTQVSLSIQPGSSDINPAHRGWTCVEQHWIKG